MEKRHPVVMVPVEGANSLNAGQLWTHDNGGGTKLLIWGLYDTVVKPKELKGYCIPQHLYILSDEEIKEGDWCYDKVLNIVFQTDKYTDFKYVNQTDNVSKVIATTDKSLSKTIKSNYIQFGDKVEETKIEFLPQIHRSFIEHFVSKWNRGNIITDVVVEYEGVVLSTTSENDYDELRLKINSKDNYITIINKAKDNWNRDEVVILLNRYNKRCQSPITDSKWIEENL